MYTMVANDFQQELDRRLDLRLEHVCSNQQFYQVFDTCSIIGLYSKFGKDLPKAITMYPNSVNVVPREVIEELEQQRDDKRRDENGTLIAPYALLNLLYEMEGKSQIFCEEMYPSLETKLDLFFAMKSSRYNVSKNTRIGKADYSIVNFAMQMDPDKTVVVSQDSDLVYMLDGLGLEDVALIDSDSMYGWVDSLANMFSYLFSGQNKTSEPELEVSFVGAVSNSVLGDPQVKETGIGADELWRQFH